MNGNIKNLVLRLNWSRYWALCFTLPNAFVLIDFFLNSMLQRLRDNTQISHIALTHSFHQDLNWFLTFLNQFNVITYFDNKKVDFDVHLDASLDLAPWHMHFPWVITLNISI